MGIALITGASSGFGQMIARDLAHAGHTAYASMRDTQGKNAARVTENAAFERLESIELDVQNQASVDAAVAAIIAKHGRIDIVVHNAGHMVYGPSEALTPEQLAQQYEPYFAAKAGMDALAVSYAKELAPLGIETTIVVPGAFTSGTNHFANAGSPADGARASAYEASYPPHFTGELLKSLAATVPADADPAEVGRAVVDVVDKPHGARPLRVIIDPASDGSEVSVPVIDRVRSEFLHRIGHVDLLHPSK